MENKFYKITVNAKVWGFTSIILSENEENTFRKYIFTDSQGNAIEEVQKDSDYRKIRLSITSLKGYDETKFIEDFVTITEMTLDEFLTDRRYVFAETSEFENGNSKEWIKKALNTGTTYVCYDEESISFYLNGATGSFYINTDGEADTENWDFMYEGFEMSENEEEAYNAWFNEKEAWRKNSHIEEILGKEDVDMWVDVFKHKSGE